MAGVVFYGVLWMAGDNDVLAHTFHISLDTTTRFFRVAVLVGPVLAYRIALGLQARDRRTLTSGLETGVIVRLPAGGYEEIEAPAGDELVAALTPPDPPVRPSRVNTADWRRAVAGSRADDD